MIPQRQESSEVSCVTASVSCLESVSRLRCSNGDLERVWKSPQVENGAGRPRKPRQLEFVWQNIGEESHRERGCGRWQQVSLEGSVEYSQRSENGPRPRGKEPPQRGSGTSTCSSYRAGNCLLPIAKVENLIIHALLVRILKSVLFRWWGQ